MDPIIAAAAGPTALDWVKAASPIFSGLGGKQAGPSQANSSAYTSSTFDNSGWTVNTGSGSTSAAAGLAASLPSIELALGVGLLAMVAWKKLRS